jgi:hypothetical protein
MDPTTTAGARDEYVDIYLSPLFFAPSDSNFKVHHIVPIPPSLFLRQKWDYILSRFKVWYQDSDGDNITIGRFPELITAIQEFREEQKECRFFVSKGGPARRSSLADFMDEMNRVKLRYEVIGNVGMGQIRMDKKTRRITPYFPEKVFGLTEFERLARRMEEPIDPAVFAQDSSSSPSSEDRDNNLINLDASNVSIGRNVQVGSNVHINDQPVFERDDRSPTPLQLRERDDRSPTPTFPATPPSLHPVDRDDDLIELPCRPASQPLDPLPPAATQMEIDDPPEQPPQESDFPSPLPSFPGTFPQDLDDTPISRFQDRILSIVQMTMDSLAGLGHTVTTQTQDSGIPNLQENLQSMRESLISQRDAMQRTLQMNLQTLRNHQGRIQRDVQAGIHASFGAIRDGITRAGNAANGASDQVRDVIMQRGVGSEGVERMSRDLRAQFERLERALHDVTLRMQQSIDAGVQRPENEAGAQRTENEESATASVGAGEEDIYGSPLPLPGAFPVDVERTRIEECTERLIEMGYFTSEQRDLARSLSVVVDGELSEAIDVLEASN